MSSSSGSRFTEWTASAQNVEGYNCLLTGKMLSFSQEKAFCPRIGHMYTSIFLLWVPVKYVGWKVLMLFSWDNICIWWLQVVPHVQVIPGMSLSGRLLPLSADWRRSSNAACKGYGHKWPCHSCFVLGQDLRQPGSSQMRRIFYSQCQVILALQWYSLP